MLVGTSVICLLLISVKRTNQQQQRVAKGWREGLASARSRVNGRRPSRLGLDEFVFGAMGMGMGMREVIRIIPRLFGTQGSAIVLL